MQDSKVVTDRSDKNINSRELTPLHQTQPSSTQSKFSSSLKKHLQKKEHRNSSRQHSEDSPGHRSVSPSAAGKEVNSSKLGYLKIKRCLNTGLFLTRMQRIGENVRLYGTSCTLYNLNYRPKIAVKHNLVPPKEIPPPVIVPWYIINPSTKLYFYWRIFQSLLILYAISLLPYSMVFINSTSLHTFELVINFFFFFEFFIGFLTAYVDDSKLIFDLKKVAINYWNGFAFIDFLSGFPLMLIFRDSPLGPVNMLFKVFKFKILAQDLKVLKIFYFDKFFKSSRLSLWARVNQPMVTTIKLLFSTLLIVHYATCIWCALPALDPDYALSWLFSAKLTNLSNPETYLFGFYYCLTTLTTVGYGDILARTNYEVIFAIVWMMLGVAFYSILIGSLSVYFTSKGDIEEALKKRLEVVDEFCRGLGIEEGLQDKLEECIKYSSSILAYQWLDDSENVFNDLDLQLKFEFLSAIHHDLIRDCKFFRHPDKSFITKVVPNFKPMYLKAGEFLWQKGEPSNYIYFLIKGEITNYLPNFYLGDLEGEKNANAANAAHSEDEKKCLVNLIFGIYTRITYLGEIDIIMNFKRRYHCQATRDCDLLLFSKMEFEKIVQREFPFIYKKLEEDAINRYEAECKAIETNRSMLYNKFAETLVTKGSNAYQQIEFHTVTKSDQNRLNVNFSQLYEESLDVFPLENVFQTVNKARSGKAENLNGDLPEKALKSTDMDALMYKVRDSQENLKKLFSKAVMGKKEAERMVQLLEGESVEKRLMNAQEEDHILEIVKGEGRRMKDEQERIERQQLQLEEHVDDLILKLERTKEHIQNKKV